MATPEPQGMPPEDGGEAKSAVKPGKLDSLAKEDLVKFVKKQAMQLQKLKAQCDKLNTDSRQQQQKPSSEAGAGEKVLEKKLREAEDEIAAMQEEKDEMLAAYNAVQQQQELAAGIHTTLEDAVHKAMQEKADLNKELVKCQGDLKTLSSKNKELMDELECQQMKQESMAATFQCLQEEQTTLGKENQALNEQIKVLTTARDQVMESLQSIKQQQRQNSDEASSLKQSIAELTNERDNLLKQLQEGRRSQEGAAVEVRELLAKLDVSSQDKTFLVRMTSERDELAEHLMVLKETLETSTVEIKSLKVKLEVADRKRGDQEAERRREDVGAKRKLEENIHEMEEVREESLRTRQELCTAEEANRRLMEEAEQAVLRQAQTQRERDNIANEVTKLEEMICEKNRGLEELHRKQSIFDTRLQETGDELRIATEQRDEAYKEVDELKSELGEMSSQLKSSNQALESSEQDKINGQADEKELRTELETLKQRLLDFQDSNGELKILADTLTSEKQMLSAEISDVRSEMETQLGESKSECDSMRLERDQVFRDLEEEKRNILDLQGQLDTAEAEKERLQLEITRWKQLEESNKTIGETLDSLKVENEAMVVALSDKDSAYSLLLKDIQDLRKERDCLLSRIEEFEEKNRNLIEQILAAEENIEEKSSVASEETGMRQENQESGNEKTELSEGGDSRIDVKDSFDEEDHMSKQDVQLQDLRKECDELNEAVHKLETKVKELDGKLELSQAELKASLESVNDLRQELNSTRNDAVKLQAEVQSKAADLEKAQGHIQELDRELDSSRDDAVKLQAEVRSKAADLEKAQEHIQELDRELDSTRNDAVKLQAEVRSKAADLETAQGHIQELDRELGSSRDEAVKLQAEVRSKAADLEKAQGHIEKLDQELEDNCQKMRAPDPQLKSVIEENEDLQTQLVAIQEAHLEAVNLCTDYEIQLKVAHSDKENLKQKMEETNMRHSNEELKDEEQLGKLKMALESSSKDLPDLSIERDNLMVQLLDREAELERQFEKMAATGRDLEQAEADLKCMVDLKNDWEADRVTEELEAAAMGKSKLQQDYEVMEAKLLRSISEKAKLEEEVRAKEKDTELRLTTGSAAETESISRIQDLESKIGTLEAEKQTFKKNFEKLKKASQTKLQRLQEQMDTTQEERDALANRLDDTERNTSIQSHDYQEQISDLREEVRSLEARINSAREENQKLEEANYKLESTVKDSIEEKAALFSDLQAALSQQSIGNQEDTLHGSERANQTLRDRLEINEAQLKEQEKEVKQLTIALEKALADNENVVSTESRSTEDNLQAMEAMQTSSVDTSLQPMLDAKIKQYKESEEKALKFKSLVVKARKELEQAKKQIVSQTEELNHLRVEKEQLNQLLSGNRQHMENFQSLQVAYEKLQDSLDVEKDLSKQLQKKLNETLSDLKDLSSECTQTKIAKEELARSCDHLLKQRQTMEGTVTELKHSLLAAEGRRDKEKDKNDRRDKELDQALAKIQGYERDVGKQKESFDSASRKLEVALKEASQSSMMGLEIADYEKTVSNLNHIIQEKEDEISRAAAEIQRLHHKAESSQKEIEASDSQRVLADERGNKLKALLMKAKKDLTDSKKAEADQRLAEATLRGNIERLSQQCETLKVELASIMADNRKLHDQLRTSNDANLRTVRGLEQKNRTLEEELGLAREELAQIQEEFDGYKVRVHSVLKQQKTRDSPQVAMEMDKHEQERLEKVNKRLLDKLQENRDELRALSTELELLQDEHDRLLQRHSDMLLDAQRKEAGWRDRMEKLRMESQSRNIEHCDSIRELTAQNETLTQTFKAQISQLQEDHRCTVDLIQHQLETVENQLYRSQQEQRRQQVGMLTGSTPSQEAAVPQQQETGGGGGVGGGGGPSLEEREQGEGMENTDAEPRLASKQRMSSSASLSSPLVPLSQLLSEPSVESVPSIVSLSGSTAEEDYLRSELTAAKKKLDHFGEIMSDSEATIMRLTEQAKVLKEEIRRLERNQQREDAISNMEYLKNIILKFLVPGQPGEKQHLVPVLSTMLKLSAQEQQEILATLEGEEGSAAGKESTKWGSYLHRWSGGIA